jgi:hypothetical protein
MSSLARVRIDIPNALNDVNVKFNGGGLMFPILLVDLPNLM